MARVRAIQKDRYGDAALNAKVRLNAHVDGEDLERVAAPSETGRALLLEAANAMKLSARGYHRVLRVARTLADMEAAAEVSRIHIAEALSYRRIRPST